MVERIPEGPGVFDVLEVTRGWPCFRLTRDMVIDPVGYRVYVRGSPVNAILTSPRPEMTAYDRTALERLLELQKARAELVTAQADARTEELWKIDAALERAAVSALERVLARG